MVHASAIDTPGVDSSVSRVASFAVLGLLLAQHALIRISNSNIGAVVGLGIGSRGTFLDSSPILASLANALRAALDHVFLPVRA